MAETPNLAAPLPKGSPSAGRPVAEVPLTGLPFDKPARHLGTLAVGAAFGAGWTPCIGPVLGAILTLAGTSETVWSGMGLLAAYSAGLAIPFLLAALALDRFLVAFTRVRRFIPVLEKGSGVLLVLLGILLMTGTFTVLTGYLARFTPDWILERV